MKIEKFLVLLCLVTSVRSFQGTYCAICSGHSLCKYSLEGPSPECRGYDKASKLTNKHIQEIVKRINERRHLIAMGTLKRFPQAANMKKVRWSIKLAKFAQRWADQCDSSVKPSREDDCRDLVVEAAFVDVPSDKYGITPDRHEMSRYLGPNTELIDQIAKKVDDYGRVSLRSLASMQVGQNIATVLGPSPGLGVKSLVDVWFMLNLQYTGSVAYYNQSMDFKTNYFTQLIWAETAFVGCGRAKFLIEELNTSVERLVCNFAPKGNIHGKPIYTIGYPATQCSGQMIPDVQFPGLCQQTATPAPYFFEKVTTSSSLLRILNLSNNSLKLELDPNNMKHINQNNSGFNGQRHQKTRQVYLNNSNGGLKRDSPHLLNSMRNLENYNEPQYTQRQFTQERGHSRMYHGIPASKESVYNNHDVNHVHSDSNFRRSDYTTSVPYLTNSIGDARKHYIGPVPMGPVPMGPVPMGAIPMGPVPMGPMAMVDSQCTRHNCLPPEPPCKSKNNECTRGQDRHCPQENPCQYHARVDKVCPCNSQPPPTDPPCECMRKCPQTPGCPTFTTSHCQGNGYRKLGGDETDKSSHFDNYDLFHNLEVKSGEENPTRKENTPFQNLNTDNMGKDEFDRSEFDLYKQVKAFADESQQKQRMRKIQDSYRNFDYSERKKRDHDDQTFKPFWQMEEYNQNMKNNVDLKSIRYTTLSNKKKRKSRKTELTTRMPIITETITIKPKDKPIAHNNPRGRVTEKYLSFDELMHLRKLSTAETMDIDGDARRRADSYALREGENSTVTEETLTANTPFIRMKQCTRKLTCTWTGAMNGAGGAGGAGGNGVDGAGALAGKADLFGSRTPSGYVEGCTRTSTCTRIHMDRNKMVSTTENPNDGAGGSGSADHNDEDYCEKRSFNVRRRNLDDNGVTGHSIEYQKTSTDLPILTTAVDDVITSLEAIESETPTNDFHCICYDDVSRVKRGGFDDVFSKKCMSKKCNMNFKHLHDMCPDSRSKDILNSYACNGTIFTQSWFCSVVMLNHCCMWMLYISYCLNN